MCGHFHFHTPPNLLAQRYWEHTSPVASTAPRYNIAPGTDILSICLHANTGFVLKHARWGLRPDWASGKGLKGRIKRTGAEVVLGWWQVSDRGSRTTHDDAGLIKPLDEQ